MTRGAVAAIIPARLGSTRLPHKPLLRESGKYLIQHVVEQVQKASRLSRVIVATDAEEIADAVRSFGGEARLTRADHPSGTDRVSEVASELDCAAVVNVQGDEPEIDPRDLDRLAEAVLADDAAIVTLAAPIRDEEAWQNRNCVKVVTDVAGRALWFSRSPLPWSDDPGAMFARGLARQHVGVYAYTRDALLRFTRLAPAPLEGVERLEQLRALHHGIPIRVLDSAHESRGIDTAEDYARFLERRARRAPESR